MAFNYPRFPQLPGPNVDVFLETPKSVSVDLSFGHWSNATAFEQLFHLISGKNRGTVIKIHAPITTAVTEPESPETSLKKFVEYLFTISNQRPSENDKNLVKISFRADQHKNIEGDLQAIRDSGKFETIEILGTQKITNQRPFPDRNVVDISYNGNLLVVIDQDGEHHRCHRVVCCWQFSDYKNPILP